MHRINEPLESCRTKAGFGNVGRSAAEHRVRPRPNSQNTNQGKTTQRPIGSQSVCDQRQKRIIAQYSPVDQSAVTGLQLSPRLADIPRLGVTPRTSASAAATIVGWPDTLRLQSPLEQPPAA